MLSKITMNGIGSYKKETKIKLKKYNFFYGLNGTGKTLISDFLLRHGEEKLNYSEQDIKDDERDFSSCNHNLQNNSDYKILVYNRSFIEKNFVEQDSQKGIFNLSKENIDVQKKIEVLKEEKEEAETKKGDKEIEKSQVKTNQKKLRGELEDEVWKAKELYPNCTQKFHNSKAGLLDEVLKHKPDNTEDYQNADIKGTLSNLEGEIKYLCDKDSAKNNYNQISISQNIEADGIWKEVITGSENHYLTELVEKLHHSDWLRQGVEDYIDEVEFCPFCKQGMDGELKNKIKYYFDAAYRNKIKTIEELKNSYKAQIDWANYKAIPNITENLDALKEKYDNNIKQIEEKIKNPSSKISLESTRKLLEKVNNIIKEFNDALKNKKITISNKKKEAYRLLYVEYNCQGYQKESAKYTGVISKADEEITKFDENIKKLEDEIANQQKNTQNLKEATENINKNIKSCGLYNFEIELVEESENGEGKYYKIVRDGGDKDKVYKTLSEGEKTLITFLYFLELCKGNTNNESVDNDKKIIVIDDPISSLDSSLVFEISTLIKNHITPEVHNKNQKEESVHAQFILLTHHLYFFHEFSMHRLFKKEGRFFTIKKSYNAETYNYSIIDKTEPNNLPQNNYESYWSIYREIINDQSIFSNNKVIIFNTIRNILECFLSFNSPDGDFKKFQTFSMKNNIIVRYLNRNSHSDAKNIIETATDDNKIKEDFKAIFNEMNASDHYENWSKCLTTSDAQNKDK